MAGIRDFIRWTKGLTSPGDVHEEVTAGTAKVFTGETVPRGGRVNATGTLVLTDSEGTVVTYNMGIVGEVLPFRPYGIGAGSTADVILWW